MHDVTCCAQEPHATSRSSREITRTQTASPAGYADAAAGDDLLAAMLVRMWSLASGRRLEPGVGPGQLSADELVDFWADDFSPAVGRHAAPHAAPAGTVR
jgi:hypothetical protein